MLCAGFFLSFFIVNLFFTHQNTAASRERYDRRFTGLVFFGAQRPRSTVWLRNWLYEYSIKNVDYVPAQRLYTIKKSKDGKQNY